MKHRRIRFTETALRHVRLEKQWWVENRTYTEVFADEFEEALAAKVVDAAHREGESAFAVANAAFAGTVRRFRTMPMTTSKLRSSAAGE